MSLAYQREASLLTQLVMRSAEVQPSQMTVLQLSYAEQERPRKAITFPIQTLPDERQDARCNLALSRMRSRCCGLIEGRWLSRICEASELHAGFLHRTVIDLLKSPTLSKSLRNLTQGSTFSLDELLLSSSLMEMKVLPDRMIDSSVPSILTYASYLPLATYSDYLDQMEHVAHQYETSDPELGGWQWRIVEALGELKNDPAWNQELLPCPFFTLLGVCGLSEKLEHRIQEPGVRSRDKALLLTHLVLSTLTLIGRCIQEDFSVQPYQASRFCCKMGLIPTRV